MKQTVPRSESIVESIVEYDPDDSIQRKPIHALRSIVSMGFLLLELGCVVLLITSLGQLNQPTWTEQKLAELQQNPDPSQSLLSDQIAAQSSGQTTDQMISSKTEDSAQPISAMQALSETNQADGPNQQPAASKLSELNLLISSVFGPLPAVATPDYELTSELVDLGRHLFYDPRLSADNMLSCNSCHLLDQYGVDGLALSVGMNGKTTERNTPSVYNAAIQVAQFWDGRSPTVEDQAIHPILASDEMGMVDEQAIKERLSAIPAYVALFNAAFPDQADSITLKNIGIAIGAFERGLMTPAPFDRFLEGDSAALNEQAQRGLAVFVKVRCATCHIGATVGGLVYKRLGEVEAYPTTDQGRIKVTQKPTDEFVFKVPSLRNVTKTAPYLHDGSIQRLDETIRMMVRYQLGKTLSDQEVADMLAFFDSLTGELPQSYIQKPSLPADAIIAETSTTQIVQSIK